MGALSRALRVLLPVAGVLLPLAAYSAPGIVLIGDEHRGVIMRDIAAGESSEIRRLGDIYQLEARSVGVTLRSLAPGGAITALADALHAGEIGLVVVDATRGPGAAVREHILIARQARTPMLAVMFANVERLHQGAGEETSELLELEIREIRQLLAAYELDADSVRIFFDAPFAGLESEPDGTGVLETLRALALFGPRRADSGDMQTVEELWGAMYLLTGMETGGRAQTLSPNDALVVWSEGMHAKATLDSQTAYHPGDFREMPLSMESPLRLREGSRLLLLNGDRVIGLGAVTQIGRSP